MVNLISLFHRHNWKSIHIVTGKEKRGPHFTSIPMYWVYHCKCGKFKIHGSRATYGFVEIEGKCDKDYSKARKRLLSAFTPNVLDKMVD